MNSRHAIRLTVFPLLLFCCSVAMASTGVPTPPEGVVASAVSCEKVELTWGASSDTGSAGLFGYKVYRNGTFLKWALFPATSTTDSAAAESTTHSYTVAALSNDGKLSPQSAPGSTTTPGCSEAPSGPTAPTGLTASATDCEAVELAWNTPSQSGTANLLAYRIVRDGSFLDWVFPLATSTVDRRVAEGTTYTYMVEALNNVGELSPQSAPTSVLTPPCSSASPPPPSAPTGLTASATDCSTIRLRWNAPDGGSSGIARYQVYRNGSFLKHVLPSATSTLDGGLAAITTHTYRISVVDDTERESAQSTPASAMTPSCANEPPVADAGPDQFTQSLVTISFNGSGCSDPDGTITSYSWNFGDGTSASGATVSHAYSAADTYSVTLTVSDNGGLTASDTASVQVSNRVPVAKAGPDKTAPAETPVSLDGSGSSDPDGTITSYSWNLGDGASASGSTVSHTYSQPGDYSVTLTVRDDTGASDSDTAQVTVTETTSGGGEFLWAQRFGDTGLDVGQAVATDSSGDVVVTGRVLGTVDLGSGATCSETIFVAKYNAEGDHLWSHCFGGLGGGSGLAITTDSNDNVLMTGYFTGTVNFGGALLTSAGGADVFIAKYTAQGVHLWSNSFGSPVLTAFIRESGNAIAVGPSDDVVVTGIFEGTADFGGALLTSAGQTDIFVAKYSSAGQHLWSKSFGDRGSLDSGKGVAVDGNSNVLVAGSFAGSVDFGGGRLTGPGSTVFVAKYSPAGGHLWSQSFGGSNSDSAKSIVADGSGDFVLTGAFEGSVDFGGGPLIAIGDADVFVAKYSSSGTHLWSRRYGGPIGDDTGNALAMDASGSIVVAGSFIGTVDFGGGPLVGASSTEVFVAKYTPTGAHLWSHRFGARSTQEANAVAMSDSQVFVSGIMARTVDFGGGPLSSAGGTDVFLLCLEP